MGSLGGQECRRQIRLIAMFARMIAIVSGSDFWLRLPQATFLIEIQVVHWGLHHGSQTVTTSRAGHFASKVYAHPMSLGIHF